MSAAKYVPLLPPVDERRATSRPAADASAPAASASLAAAKGMQRCPYLHEMRERLLGDTPVVATTTATSTSQPPIIAITTTPKPGTVTTPPTQAASPVRSVTAKYSTTPTAEKAQFGDAADFAAQLARRTPSPQVPPMSPAMDRRYNHLDGSGGGSSAGGAHQVGTPIGTVVKLNSDGYGSHTSPAHQRTPLVPRDLGEDYTIDLNDDPGSPMDPRKPKNAKTSLFIITSLVYAMLLIVVCIAYVISDVSTHKLPIIYYEGFFTYLYGASILFLLYVFCFLLQESTCCNGSAPKEPKPPKVKKEKPAKAAKKGDKAEDKDKADKEAKGVAAGKELIKGGGSTKTTPFQDSAANVDVEAGPVQKTVRKRKTTHNDPSHGSFFLRVGAIAFGLGTMIYVGLEFGTFFETPFTSPCHQILRGVNPLLQMIFTFMQMYFIFMNSRLNIHRFKVLARFGLMHICATNICVWIRTLVLESLKEIIIYHKGRGPSPDDGAILESIRTHSLRHAGTVMGTNLGPEPDWEPIDLRIRDGNGLGNQGNGDPHHESDSILSRMVHTTARALTTAWTTTMAAVTDAPTTASSTTTTAATTTTLRATTSTTTSTTTATPLTTSTLRTTSTSTPAPYESSFVRKLQDFVADVATTSTTAASTTMATSHQPGVFRQQEHFYSDEDESEAVVTSTISPLADFIAAVTTPSTTTTTAASTTSISEALYSMFSLDSAAQQLAAAGAHNDTFESQDALFPEAMPLIGNGNGAAEGIVPTALAALAGVGSAVAEGNTSCGRINIMGSIVQDSAPYLYPFVIEYSLIGAVVIYVMWKHIGRYPKYTEEDLEHRLEVMLSRRAVAMAQSQSGRVDCVGASKGLFFGLLLLVGSLICLILFFVLVRHSQFSLLAIYLADASHCALMAFAVFAIFVGFIRVQTLKFRCEDQSNLNDILLRISAFGLFVYSVFSVIAGSLNAFTSEPNLLVMVTGLLAVGQVVLQLLFIADVSRRRVHLPEHDRSKPGRQIVTFLLICNIAMFAIYTFEAQKVFANPVQLDFYGFIAWSLIQRVTLPLCIFHRFHSAVTLAEVWKTTYKARLE